MARDSGIDELAATAAFWFVALPIMVVLWICRVYQERKEAEAAAEAARVYRLPDDFIHI